MALTKRDRRRKLTAEQASRLNRRLQQAQGPDTDMEVAYKVLVRDHGRRAVIVGSTELRTWGAEKWRSCGR